MAGKINYSQQEKDVISSLKEMEVAALNIKRINASKKEPNLKNYSIEVRQRLDSNSGFNLLSYVNPNDSSFQSSTGVRVGWMTIKAQMAVDLFGLDSNELDNLPIDGGVTRLFIGKLAPSFKMPDGSTKVLQLQKVAKLLSDFDPTTPNGKYKHENILQQAKKAGPNGRYMMGAKVDKATGEITSEYVIEECVVKSSTLVIDPETNAVTGMINDNWEHIEIEEYVTETVATAVAPQNAEQLTILPTL